MGWGYSTENTEPGIRQLGKKMKKEMSVGLQTKNFVCYVTETVEDG